MRVFLDTNVLVSAFTARGLSADVFRLVLQEHDLFTGEINVTELRRVLSKKMKAPADLIAEAESLLREHNVVPKPKRRGEHRVRDADDEWVLASALAAEADILITGDADLLSLGPAAPLPIVSPRGFWEMSRHSE